MSFIVGLWTGKAHFNNNCPATIWANASLVMSSKLPRNISLCSHIYYRTDDFDFVILNHAPFQKVRTSQSKTFLSYFFSQWCWPTLSLQAHACLRVENYCRARAIFINLFLSFSFHCFGMGFFFIWKEDLFPVPVNQHHYIDFGSLPPAHHFVGFILIHIKVY